MQAKDIPEWPIIAFLAGRHGVGAHWFFNGEDSVRSVIPEGTPDKVLLAKMRALIKRGLVDGCCCGCRGDFALTAKGLEHMADSSTDPS